jgi:hypothetical protein
MCKIDMVGVENDAKILAFALHLDVTEVRGGIGELE